jgi:hypothetical protein
MSRSLSSEDSRQMAAMDCGRAAFSTLELSSIEDEHRTKPT